MYNNGKNDYQNNHQTEHLKRPDLQSGSAAWDIPAGMSDEGWGSEMRAPPSPQPRGRVAVWGNARKRGHTFSFWLLLLLLCLSLSFFLSYSLSLVLSLAFWLLHGRKYSLRIRQGRIWQWIVTKNERFMRRSRAMRYHETAGGSAGDLDIFG